LSTLEQQVNNLLIKLSRREKIQLNEETH